MIQSLVALASVALSPLSLAGRPAPDPSPESIVVTGTGAVSGTPDTLTADFGVEAGGSTVSDALNKADVAATRMRDALVRAGIARIDLRTSNLNIGTKVDDAQTITGYTVTEGLTAKIRNLPRAGALMSAGIAAGGDAARLNGVSFGIENDTALLAEARKEAFADARQKAELYAREAGRPLGRVVKVSEDAGPATHFFPGAMDSRVPIEPGQQQLSVTVTVEWVFGPAGKG